jgi:hypothetical protein
MPGPVLHVGATVLCTHAGQAQPVNPFPRVLVSGQPVVTLATTYAISACSLASTSSPPCAAAQWTTGALRVTAGGQPLVLQSSQALCVPTGTGLMPVTAQTRVVAA